MSKNQPQNTYISIQLIKKIKPGGGGGEQEAVNNLKQYLSLFACNSKPIFCYSTECKK